MPEIKFLVRGETIGDVVSDYVRQVTKAAAALSEGNSYMDPRAEVPFDESTATEYTFAKIVHFKATNETGSFSPKVIAAATREATFAITSVLEAAINNGSLITGDAWREREATKREAAND